LIHPAQTTEDPSVLLPNTEVALRLM